MNILKATKRTSTSTGQVNKLRSDGSVPAVLYGGKKNNLNISLKKLQLQDIIKTETFMSKVFDLDVDGSDQDPTGGYAFTDSKYGYYNAYGNYEKGSGNDRTFTDELKEIIYNTGFEWQYSETFVVRLGFIYDIEGDIKNPTFGAGLDFDKYGFDFGYTHGDESDSRSETMYFSLSLGL